jgi:hypothetical protein
MLNPPTISGVSPSRSSMTRLMHALAILAFSMIESVLSL